MMKECFPLSLKYSAMAHPEYGAKNWRGAASEAGGGHYNGISQGIVVVQGLHDVGHGGSFLANSHVDAEQLLLGVS